MYITDQIVNGEIVSSDVDPVDYVIENIRVCPFPGGGAMPVFALNTVLWIRSCGPSRATPP